MSSDEWMWSSNPFYEYHVHVSLNENVKKEAYKLYTDILDRDYR